MIDRSFGMFIYCKNLFGAYVCDTFIMPFYFILEEVERFEVEWKIALHKNSFLNFEMIVD